MYISVLLYEVIIDAVLQTYCSWNLIDDVIQIFSFTSAIPIPLNNKLTAAVSSNFIFTLVPLIKVSCYCLSLRATVITVNYFLLRGLELKSDRQTEIDEDLEGESPVP